MEKRIALALVTLLSASVLLSSHHAVGEATPRFVTIGSGETTGLYFPTGLAIAKLINDGRTQYGLRATVQSTPGSVFNVNALMAGYLEFGLVQSDAQYQAVQGLAEWSAQGPQTDLRAVFSFYTESVSLVASVEANITSLADLKGKRVRLGNPRSGRNQTAIDALHAVGLKPERDLLAQYVRASDAPRLLQDDHLDAFFYTVGHPSELLTQATTGTRKVRFIPIHGLAIDTLVASRVYYTKTIIPVAEFYEGAENPVNVDTFGVRATLCTSAKVPDHVVYMLTKAVFENFEQFQQLHPAYTDVTREGMLEGLSAPMHPGALQYFREVGLMH